MTVKEFEKQLTDMVNNFDAKDYKKNALKELDDLEEKGIHIPYSAFIVHNYPDFNHIELKVTQLDTFVMKICVNPEVLKDNPKAIKGLAKMFKGWLKKGTLENV